MIIDLVQQSDEVVSILENKIKPVQETEHCLICHKNFDPKYNSATSCKVESYNEGDCERGGCGCRNWDCLNFSCINCGESFCEGDDHDFCYVGNHCSTGRSEYDNLEEQCEICNAR